MKPGQFFVMGAAAALGLVLSACGGNPAAPTGAGVTLRGVAVNQGVGAAGLTALSSRSAAAGPSTITVTVQENTSITTTISGNGTFELQGLPTGTFTLVFSSNGVTLGTITITSVPDQAEIEIVVQLSTTNVTLVKVTINGSDETDNDTNGTSPGTTKSCLIEGGKVGAGIELEGSISEVTTKDKAFKMLVNGQRASDLVSVDTSGATTFSCAGVKGTCDATLIAANARVHVSGKLDSCSLTEAKVSASSVKFQH